MGITRILAKMTENDRKQTQNNTKNVEDRQTDRQTDRGLTRVLDMAKVIPA